MPESDIVSAVNAPPGVSVDWSGRLARRTRDRTDPGIGGILALANAQDIINFSGGFPDPSVFPVEETRAIVDRLLEEDVAIALQYAPSEGIASTRDALAERLLQTQGRRPADGELMVTSGGIDAITLIGKSMLDAGDHVLVEAPTYLGAVAGFAGFDARVSALPAGPDGLDVEALADLLARSTRPPKLLYVIPDYQNPSGGVLEMSRREAVAELCRRHGVLIVEDVAYRELGFDDTGLPSLWSIAPDITVQIGTFSKIVFPGIRLGWAAGPAPVIAELVVAKQNSDQCAGALGQRLVEAYLRGGHLDRALPRARALYRSRGLEMDAALTRHFGDRGEWARPRGGFFCWLRVPGANTTAAAPAALASSVAYVPGEGFFNLPGNVEHLRLSFSRVELDQIDPGIARLADIFRAAGA